MAEETSERIEFSVAATSRLPKERNAYDPIAHCYLDDYVNPTAWQLNIEIGAAPLAENVAAHRWQVVQVDGEFRHQVEHQNKAAGMESISVKVPAQGHYLVTLTVDLKDGRQLSYERHFHLRDFLVVAIGDSYFCGEGTPDKPGKVSSVAGAVTCNLATFTKFLAEKTPLHVPMEREAQWQEEKVHRSHQSGPSLAVTDVQVPSLGAIITFLNFSRSGSSVEQGLLNPRPQDEWTELGQIEELKQTVGERPIDALLISVGGNDIEFSDRLIDLIRDDLVLAGAGDGLVGDDEMNRRQEVAEARRKLQELPERMNRLAEAIEPLEAKQVYLVEYPTAQFDSINENGDVVVSSGCGIFDGPDMDIDGRDAQAIKESGRRLNQTLSQAAHRHGWIMVGGIAEAFAGHGLCSPEPYFISAEESCRTQGDFKGTLHPNRQGHRVYGGCIRKALNRYTVVPEISARAGE
ncbi:MAG: hypothetical protein R3300_17760 [Candidatus Promineifilaceae bacterium]|nr:hypothetical protein [Candidatus Promineifilaceae bacterium]